MVDAGTLAGIASVRNDLFPSFSAMPRTIGILIFPEFQLPDAAGPITAFETAGRETAPPAYRLRVIARAPGPVASSSGGKNNRRAAGEGSARHADRRRRLGHPRSLRLPAHLGLCARRGRAGAAHRERL